MGESRVLFRSAAAAACLVLGASPAWASDVSGTVTFQGNVAFAAPIPGIAFSDLTVSPGPGIVPTDGGEHCTIDAPSDTGDVGVGGAFPDVDPLAVPLTIGRGGPNPPDGTCLLQLRATGTDGVSVSAKGTVTIEVSVADIDNDVTVMVPDTIVVRQSKAVAGVSKDCLKYVKKQMKLRAKCNSTLLKLGATEGALKCKAAEDEPVDCDPADYAEAVVALGYGDNDQQLDPMTAEGVDPVALADQLKCQKNIGKAAVNFAAARSQRVQKYCVDALADTEECRLQAARDVATKLTAIDKCVPDQLADMMAARLVPEVGDECGDCIAANVLDRKCLKDCFELQVATLSDGLIGDVPECGNGIQQGGESCDDGNVMSGDGCSATCVVEP